MPAVEQDIVVEQARTFELSVQVLDPDGVNPRTDLAGYTGAMQVRTARSTTADLLAEADVTIDALTGIVTATIDHTTTASYTWRSGVYDLYITNGTRVEPLTYGDVKLRYATTI